MPFYLSFISVVLVFEIIYGKLKLIIIMDCMTVHFSNTIQLREFQIIDGNSHTQIDYLSGYRTPWLRAGLTNSVILHFVSNTFGVYRGWNLTWSGKFFLGFTKN